MPISDERLDELLDGCAQPGELLGEAGLIRQPKGSRDRGHARPSLPAPSAPSVHSDAGPRRSHPPLHPIFSDPKPTPLGSKQSVAVQQAGWVSTHPARLLTRPTPAIAPPPAAAAG